MATLSQFFGTVVTGTIVTTGSFVAFGVAVKKGWNSNLTPRAWSRPKDVIKNVLRGPYYGISWLFWAMRQHYIDLLSGIPGTGTRNNGWSGPTLKTNVDAVIQIRFHMLQLKVSVVATILMMFMLLPLYYSTKCDPIQLGLQTCLNQLNLTDFEQTTISNVPQFDFNPLLNSTTAVVINETYTFIIEPRDPYKTRLWVPGLTGRFVAPVLVVAIITFYACYLLWYEWVECIALRRVYYLESDYFMERIEELDSLKSNTYPEDNFQKIRPPYLPHPEMRDTIPNVSLNSVLYQLPNHLKNYKDPNTKKNLLERQLEATINFFDSCVPNQPGFTSSVVAATIIPDAALVKGAWMKWYKCGKKLRRLRYLKSILEKRKELESQGIRSLYDYVDAAKRAPVEVAKATGAATEKAVKATGVATEKAVGHMAGMLKKTQKGEHREETDNLGVEGEGATITPFQENSEKETPDEVQHDIEKQSPDVEEKPRNEPEGGTKDGEKESLETDDDKSSDGAEKKVNILEQFVNVLGLNKQQNQGDSEDNLDKDVPEESHGDQGDNTTDPSHRLNTSVYHDASPLETLDEEETADPGKNSKSAVSVGTGVIAGSGVYFDAKASSAELLRTTTDAEEENNERFEYKSFDPEDFAKWIGYAEETECEEIVDTLGVEELSVYSREMSQSASNCCVYGFNLAALKFLSIVDLEELIQETWDEVREANAELLQVRADIFRKESKLPKDKKEDIDNEGEDVDCKNKNSSICNSQGNPTNDDDVAPADLEQGVTSGSFSDAPGLRQRPVPSARAQYRMAQSLVRQMQNETADDDKKPKDTNCCSMSNLACYTKETSAMATNFLDQPSFAVVTFTSRQSAIAARQCLADGKGVDRWSAVDAIPVAPLADAPPGDIFFCRGCCRPVTLTINEKEKKLRKLLVWTFYFFFCCLYTVPLALTSQLLNPQYLATLYPDSPIWSNSNGFFYRFFAGISSGMLYSLFFSILPQVFKYLAFMLGSASSIPKGEDNALRFYWYFMLVTAFTGSTLAQMLLNGLFQGDLSDEFKDGVLQVGQTIPTQQAPVWLNWMITRTLITLPMNYLFQFMTFLYGWLKMKWLNRVMRGGGPGGPPPYRINVDSGTVFMCITTLAPVAPIIAPFATLYYVIFIPMLRWLHIFVYRPKYDAGGSRLPIYHEIIISSLILGQMLTSSCIFLKQQFVAGVFVLSFTIPTIIFSVWTKEQFLRAYMDAGLLQTSKLDGWGHGKTFEEREKYRRWLVDCHKASYVPICLSGGEDFLTSQPSVTVPTIRELDEANQDQDCIGDDKDDGQLPPRRVGLKRWKQASNQFIQTTSQKGAVFKRYLDA